jgi:hypothetical protein
MEWQGFGWSVFVEAHKTTKKAFVLDVKLLSSTICSDKVKANRSRFFF